DAARRGARRTCGRISAARRRRAHRACDRGDGSEDRTHRRRRPDQRCRGPRSAPLGKLARMPRILLAAGVALLLVAAGLAVVMRRHAPHTAVAVTVSLPAHTTTPT